MSERKISQSILKRMKDYIEGEECGLKIKAQYVDGVVFPPSEAQLLGQWFEYECTGAMPPYDSERVPEPKRLKNGNLAKAYERMEYQVANFKALLKHYGIKIISIGEEIQYGDARGTTDIIAEVDGQIAIIDLKASGLIRDKWNPLGWEDIANSYKPKMKVLTQAIHYKYIAKNLYQTDDVPFYFWIFSTTNEKDNRIIKVEIDEDEYDLHERELADAKVYLEKQLENGFEPRPSMLRCRNCPLAHSCDHKTEFAEVESVYYSSELNM
tara:strand:+ start:1007 stop:1810 length:804 start_codon:yes stop_codon:yes gene_type:complete